MRDLLVFLSFSHEHRPLPFYYVVHYFFPFFNLRFAFSVVSLTASFVLSAATRARSFAVSDAFAIAAADSGAACLASSDITFTVCAVSIAVLAVSSTAVAVSLITPRSFNTLAVSLICLDVSRAAIAASLTASVNSSMAPLLRITFTVSLILADSSLILLAISLIFWATCSGLIVVVVVVAVGTLVLLSAEEILSI